MLTERLRPCLLTCHVSLANILCVWGAAVRLLLSLSIMNWPYSSSLLSWISVSIPSAFHLHTVSSSILCPLTIAGCCSGNMRHTHISIRAVLQIVFVRQAGGAGLQDMNLPIFLQVQPSWEVSAQCLGRIWVPKCPHRYVFIVMYILLTRCYHMCFNFCGVYIVSHHCLASHCTINIHWCRNFH